MDVQKGNNNMMSVRKKNKKKVSFRTINNWLHLVLGLGSGLIVTVVCLMGCLYVFNDEISAVLIPKQKDKYIRSENDAFILPSKIVSITDSLYPGSLINGITYNRNGAISFSLALAKSDSLEVTDKITGLLHPYTGKYLGLKTADNSSEAKLRSRIDQFFGWTLRGHRFLWLPRETGKIVVNYATLIFSITLLTGLVWWYPKKWNKSTRDKSFKIKWSAKWKRINIDLHNVVGFYSFLLVLLLCFTGMYYGITWFNKALYWSTNGGTPLAEKKPMYSDTTKMTSLVRFPVAFDKQVLMILEQYPEAHYLSISYPDPTDAKSTIQVFIRNHMDRQFNNRYYSFDRHTAAFLPNSISLFNKDFYELETGEKFRRLNYDIHVGSIWGLPTKIIAFVVTLIAGSLPITGFIIFYNRKWGKRRKHIC